MFFAFLGRGVAFSCVPRTSSRSFVCASGQELRFLGLIGVRDEQESDVFEMQKKDKELEEKQRKKLKQVTRPPDVACPKKEEWRLGQT